MSGAAARRRRLAIALSAQRRVLEAQAAGREVSPHLRTLAQPTRVARFAREKS